jgi:hypothetical protein
MLMMDADKSLSFVDPLTLPFFAKMTPYYALPMRSKLDDNPYFRG